MPPVQNPPKVHHFVPEFYLKQWGDVNGRLFQYSRPIPNSSAVKWKPVHPAATGFVPRLYELRGLSGEAAQIVEKEFMSPVDSLAADVLHLMKSGERAKYSLKEKEGWTRFLMSLWHRHPDDLEAFKHHFALNWAHQPADLRSALERDYRQRRRPSDPRTLREFMERVPPDEVERSAMYILVDLINNQAVRNKIISMFWGTATFGYNTPAILTSDRPLMMSDNLKHEDAYIIVPIGPKQIFYAVNSPEGAMYLKASNPVALVEALNLRVVSQASRFVYGMTSKYLAYVQQHMSTKPLITIADRIAGLPHNLRD